MHITYIHVSPSVMLRRQRNECDYSNVVMSAMASQITGVSIVYSTVRSGADQRTHQSFASLAFMRGIHRWPVNSPHKGQWRGMCFHLITSSCQIGYWWWTLWAGNYTAEGIRLTKITLNIIVIISFTKCGRVVQYGNRDLDQCPTAPSHHLNQCWFILKGMLWNSFENDFTRRGHELNQQYVFEYYTFKVTFTYLAVQWLKADMVRIQHIHLHYTMILNNYYGWLLL